MSFQREVIIGRWLSIIHIYQSSIKNQISLQKNNKISKLSLRKNQKITPLSFGRTSSFILGSMTIEASIVLTIFIFFVAALIQILGLAIHEVTLVGMTHNVVLKESQSVLGTINQPVVSSIMTGSSYMEIRHNYPLEKEVKLQDISVDKDIQELSLYVEEKTLFPFITAKFRVGARGYARRWTGKKRVPESKYQEEEVYITTYGEVYHKDPQCTYLAPRIQTVSKENMSSVRNEKGSKYKKCPYCPHSNQSILYITPWGDAYHSSPQCSRLKRTIQVTTLTQTPINCPCSKCGGN